MSTVNFVMLRKLGLLETLAFSFSNHYYTGWTFEATLDWGKEQ